jgi:hypothetical protein
VHPEELAQINARVRAVADRIQPLLEPHPGLARRNAHAHAWLGLKVIFGDDWRERAADYEAYDGPREQLSAEARGELW